MVVEGTEPSLEDPEAEGSKSTYNIDSVRHWALTYHAVSPPGRNLESLLYVIRARESSTFRPSGGGIQRWISVDGFAPRPPPLKGEQTMLELPSPCDCECQAAAPQRRSSITALNHAERLRRAQAASRDGPNQRSPFAGMPCALHSLKASERDTLLAFLLPCLGKGLKT